MKEYDVVVIGSGPGGYVAAIRCAQLGMKTAIIERYNSLGGTCLNVGCIPSKAWLDSSERYHTTVHSHADHGIETGDVKLNLDTMRGRVEKVVKENSDGIGFLMKKNKVDVYNGHGSFQDGQTIKISAEKEGQKDEQEIKAKKTIIATGSKPASLPGIEIDKKRVITSTEALKPSEIPQKMVLVGGGVIGLEMGSVYQRLGSQVTVVEFADQIVPTMDKDLSKGLQKILKKEGMTFHLGHAVSSVENKGKSVVVKAKNRKKDEEVSFEADYCLVAVGRKPFTERLGLENAGVELTDRGRIKVNENLQSSMENIYAIGDVIDGPMLAHKAEEDGVFVAERLNNEKPHLDYDHVPSVVYTWPEVAAVGKTEQQLKDGGIPYKSGSFPFKASGRARASNESEGLIKVLAHKETDEILGVHMIGPRCADLIAEAVLAMEYRASAEDVARVCHPHPTYSEALKEACLAATENRPIHI